MIRKYRPLAPPIANTKLPPNRLIRGNYSKIIRISIIVMAHVIITASKVLDSNAFTHTTSALMNCRTQSRDMRVLGVECTLIFGDSSFGDVILLLIHRNNW